MYTGGLFGSIAVYEMSTTYGLETSPRRNIMYNQPKG